MHPIDALFCAIMNKKLLICGAIAAALVLTACVKKEEPKQDEPKQPETTSQPETVTVIEPAPMQPLEPIESDEPEIPARVEIERQETANTTTEIRREVRPVEPTAQEPTKVEPAKPTPAPAPKVEAPKPPVAKVESKPTPSKPSSASSQSEDDAIAAAIAAATPALNN